MRHTDPFDAATAIEERELEASIAHAAAARLHYCDKDCRDDAEGRARRINRA